MPTPVGHALGGLATAWLSRASSRTKQPAFRRHWILPAACVVAAVVPDVDILLGGHRSYTHSVGAALIAGIVTWVLVRVRARTENHRATLVALTITVAYGTHILLDWLGKDTAPPFGVMALWPFSSRFYISGVDLFLETSRRYWKPSEFILGNLKALALEMIILGPIALLAWALARRRARKE
jgi:membrane-bound metal-dependent hydrolase YbcI (DUF457 family)